MSEYGSNPLEDDEVVHPDDLDAQEDDGLPVAEGAKTVVPSTCGSVHTGEVAYRYSALSEIPGYTVFWTRIRGSAIVGPCGYSQRYYLLASAWDAMRDRVAQWLTEKTDRLPDVRITPSLPTVRDVARDVLPSGAPRTAFDIGTWIEEHWKAVAIGAGVVVLGGFVLGRESRHGR